MTLSILLCTLLASCGESDGQALSEAELAEKAKAARNSTATARSSTGKTDVTVDTTSTVATTSYTTSTASTDATSSTTTTSTTTTTDPKTTTAQLSFTATDAAVTTTVTSTTGTTSTGTTSTTPVAAGTNLINPNEITLVGRFLVPSGGSGLASTAYTFGAMALGVSAASGTKPTLYITGARGGNIAYGQDPNIHVGEITVPDTLSLSSSLASLPVATFKQPMTDVLEGKIGDVFDPSVPTSAKLEVQIRGLYKSGNDLLVNAVMFYDNDQISTAGHFSRPADLTVKGQIKGPVRVAPQVGVRHTPGPMFAVPDDLQKKYNWPAIATGVNGLSINSTISNGPGLVLYDPAQIKTAGWRSSIPGLVLADYPYPGQTFAETMGYRFSMADGNPLNQNEWWTPLNHTRGGGAWLSSRETVLFTGFRGLGAPYYGLGSAPPTWGVVDPLNNTSSPHAYPYDHVMYFFDQNEYIAVALGQKSPNQVKAYATKSLPDPFAQASTVYQICGSAHDQAARRLYVMKCWPDYSTGRPLIEVYQLPN